MFGTVLLINLLGLIAAGAHLWLVVLGFRRSAGWGIALLLLAPFSTIVFAIKEWGDDIKKPFLTWAGCCAAAMGLLVVLFSQIGGFAMMEMAQQMESGELSEEEAREFMEDAIDRWEDSGMFDEDDQAQLRDFKARLRETGGSDGDANASGAVSDFGGPATSVSLLDDSSRLQGIAPPLPPPSWLKDAAPPFPVKNGYMRVPVGKADDFIGEKVLVTGTDGLEHRGTLVRAGGGRLVLEKYLRSGTFSLMLPTRDVRKVDVIVR